MNPHEDLSFKISSNRIDLTYNGALFNEEVARTFIV